MLITDYKEKRVLKILHNTGAWYELYCSKKYIFQDIIWAFTENICNALMEIRKGLSKNDGILGGYVKY